MDDALDKLLSKNSPKNQKTTPTASGNPRHSEEFTVNGESPFTVNRQPQFTGTEESPLTVNRDITPPLYRDYNTETTTTTAHSNAMDSGGCGEDLIFPKCTQNESIAISQLLATCPAEMRQIVLDEIEGARQAGVIKTNLVPFARGIMTAITRGTFTVGHGPKVIEQRKRQHSQTISAGSNQISPMLDPKALSKGTALLEKISGLRTKSR